VMLLAVMLTVCTFAAGYSSLALGTGVDTTLEQDDEIKVYIVVSPVEHPGTNKIAAIYRPYGTGKDGKAISATNADVYGQTLAVNWDESLLDLTGFSYVEGAPSASVFEGTSYYGVQMAFSSATTYVKPVVTEADGSLTFVYDSTKADNMGDIDTTGNAYKNNAGKMAGFAIKFPSNQADATVTYTGAVAELTFKVKYSATDVATAIELSDTYYIGALKGETGSTEHAYTSSSTGDAGAGKSLSLSVKAGCTHEGKVFDAEASYAATCFKEGMNVYTCTCGLTIEEPIEKTAHNYSTEYTVHTPATCTEDGVGYYYCTNEGCKDFSEEGARNPEVSVTLEKTGHYWWHVGVATLNCITDHEEFWYCKNCFCPSAEFTEAQPDGDAEVADGVFYNPADKKFYTDAEYTNEATTLGDWYYVIEAPGHDWVKNEDGSYTCMNPENGVCECTGEDRLVRYVGATDKGNGGTKETATTFKEAMTYFVEEGFSADEEAIIYVVEDINLERQQYSSRDTRNAFEEKPHDFHITITSANKNNKSTITFVNGIADEYHLYGPTTFENIKFSATEANAGTYMCARGFKLVLGKGIEMVDVEGKKTYEKTDAGIDGFGTTTEISDVKMYVVGGVRGSGSYDGFKHQSYHAEMEILSGNYHSIHYFNREVGSAYTDCTAFITIGAITTETVLPSNNDVDYNNCHVVLAYTGKFNIKIDYVFGYHVKSEGTGNRIDRLFFPGAKNSKIGDFGLNKVFKLNADVTSYYYNGIDATSMVSNFLVKGFESKAEAGLNGGYINYNMTTAPLSEWCGLYGSKFLGTESGHSYDEDGVCTFCKTKECTTHRNTAWRVEKEPTCGATGIKQQYCTECFTVLATEDIAKTGEHTSKWVASGSTFVTKCSVCGEATTVKDANGNIVVAPTDFTNIYVSKNGTGFGGFSPETPLNDYVAAMKFAAKAGGPATIHIMDEIVVDGTNKTENHTYEEPAHTNTITVRGYGDTRGIFSIGGEAGASTGNGAKIIYRVKGPMVFENMEISSGLSPAKIYFLCQHNPVEFGENISMDTQRLESGGLSSKVAIYGGCYGNASCSSNSGAQVIVRSGTYNDIVGLGVNSSCAGDVDLKILGDVTVNEFFILGAYGKYGSTASTAGNIDFTLDGNLLVNQYCSFSTAGDSAEDRENGIVGEVGDVTIRILGGTIITEGNSTAENRPVGAYLAGGKPTDRMNSLKIYYFPSVSTSQLLCNRIVAFGDKAILTTHVLTEDSYCYVTTGEHEPAGQTPIESVASTCYSEGYEIFECSECGEEYTKVLDIQNHHLVDADPNPENCITPANCISPAMKKQICDNEGCGAAVYVVVEGSAVAPNAHNIVDGVCVNCKRTEAQICVAQNGGHLFPEEGELVDGSCGSGRKYVCTNCGYVEVDIENATHNYGPYSVTVEPTETTAGIKTRTCKSCGKVDTAILSSADSLHTEAVATDASGNVADFDIALSKLTKYERAAINALIQDTSYGSEVKVSYTVDADGATNVTYSIPVPAEYNDMTNVKVVVKDDDGKFHVVDFKLDMGYIVFTF